MTSCSRGEDCKYSWGQYNKCFVLRLNIFKYYIYFHGVLIPLCVHLYQRPVSFHILYITSVTNLEKKDSVSMASTESYSSGI